MKNNFKKLLALVCMFACMMGLAACGKEQDASHKNNSMQVDEDSVLESMTSDLRFLSTYSNEQLDAYLEENNVTDVNLLAAIENWKNVREELGELKSIGESKVTVDKEQVTVKLNAEYSLRNAVCTEIFDMQGNLVSMTFTPEYTFGEKMQKAALNTVIGMGTVFLVLIGISLLIGLFKYISAAENRSREKAKKTAPAVDNVIAQIVQKEEAQTEELELVAVITAAIAAAQGTSSDGLVVRSIRKVNKTKWQRA